jgi:putative salt-induced outer membrane protein YdiY
MRIVSSGCIVLLCVVSVPALAAAQAAAPPPPPPKHEGTGEFAFVGVTGNASTQTLGLRYEAIARPGTWTFTHKTAFVQNESSDVLTARSFLYAGRGAKTLSPRLSAFGQYDYFKDRFAGVANRNTITGGITAKLVAQERQQFSVDAGAGYLNEDRLAGNDVSSAIYSFGSKYLLKISDTADLTDDFGFVGTFDNGDDWRIAHTISLTARLTGIFSLKVSSGVRYANFPAPGFKKTDTITSVALVAKYARQ